MSGGQPIPLWRAEITVPRAVSDSFVEPLESIALAVTSFTREDGGESLLAAYFESPPDRGALEDVLTSVAEAVGCVTPVVSVEVESPRDWVAETYRAFPPVAVGRYLIHGSHHREPLPSGRIGLEVDAATAFGSGEHPTTAGCLLALDTLAKRMRPHHVLDMGCGSGILGLAAARTWHCRVVAVDNDPRAVAVATENARINQVGRFLRAAVSDGYRAPIVGRHAPYDLILANILARPLCAMAGDLAAHLRPGGVAVLSGLLVRDASRVISAHRSVGLRLSGRITRDGWQTLVMKR